MIASILAPGTSQAADSPVCGVPASELWSFTGTAHQPRRATPRAAVDGAQSGSGATRSLCHRYRGRLPACGDVSAWAPSIGLSVSRSLGLLVSRSPSAALLDRASCEVVRDPGEAKAFGFACGESAVARSAASAPKGIQGDLYDRSIRSRGGDGVSEAAKQKVVSEMLSEIRQQWDALMAEPALPPASARTDDESVAVRGEVIAALPRSGRREWLYVVHDEWNQHRFASLRIWWRSPDGVLRPTQRGLSIRRSELPTVISALHGIAARLGITCSHCTAASDESPATTRSPDGKPDPVARPG